MPQWILEIAADGFWGGYRTRVQDGKPVELWEMAPIDAVLQIAQRQPEFQRNWVSSPAASQPVPLTKVFVERKQ